MPAPDAARLFHAYTNIQYRDAESFRQEVQEALDSQEQGIRSLIQSIAEKQHLTAHGAGLRIETQLDDMRLKSAGPLPRIAPRDLTID